MKVILSHQLEAEFFQIEEAARALEASRLAGGAVYTWKTAGRSNWLEKRLSCVDALGLVVLPAGLPEEIDLPDDPPDDA